MGRPNFPTNIEEQSFKKEPWIDYYVIKEGEYIIEAGTILNE